MPADEQLAQQLVERMRSEGVELVGPGGSLTDLTKTVVESALKVEMEDHLGYATHAPEGRNHGNSRNGSRAKTVLTEVDEVEIAVPRDRAGSFEPAIVKKRQRRLAGVDELVISLAAKGLTTGEIAKSSLRNGASVYPTIVKLWEAAWAEFMPFPAYNPEIRQVIYSTNAIESLHARFRRSVRARGHFPTEQAATRPAASTLQRRSTTRMTPNKSARGRPDGVTARARGLAQTTGEALSHVLSRRQE